MSTPRLSVSIPTHNNRAVLQRCLESWERFGQPSCVELVVIADGCTDDTHDYLKTYCAHGFGARAVRWVTEPNVHELMCTNRGFRETNAPLILVWQDDMFVQKPWFVPELVRCFDKDPKMGLLSLSRGLNCYPCDIPITRWEDLLDERRVRSTIGPAPWNWFRLQEVDIVIRPWVIRRAALEQVGPLDEAFRPTEWDEADLCYRLRRAGWTAFTHGYERVGAYEHLGSSTLSKSFSDNYKARVLSNGLLFHRRWAESIQTDANRHRSQHTRPASISGWVDTSTRMVRAAMTSVSKRRTSP